MHRNIYEAIRNALNVLPGKANEDVPLIVLVVGHVTYVVKDRHGSFNVEIDTGTELRARLQNNGINPDVDNEVDREHRDDRDCG